MKTNLLLKNSILLAFVTFIAISCNKENSNLVLNTTSDDTLNPIAGTITDFGLVNTDIRVMKASLVTQEFHLISSTDEVTGKSAYVDISFYVNSDHQIIPGEYFYSNSEIKSAFTFDSANFSGVVNSDGNAITDERIVNGSIIVSQDAGNYVFKFYCNFDSGVTFSGNYNGPMNYNDSPESY